MATDVNLLADIAFFKLLDDDERAVLAQQIDHQTYPTPFPFILLNLFLSTLATLQAPMPRIAFGPSWTIG